MIRLRAGLKNRIFVGGAGLALVGAAMAVGQSTPIPMKLGLWDEQVKSTTVVKMPPEMEARIAAMPAAQQARMRAVMSGQKPLVNEYKSCVAKQTSLDEFLDQAQERPGAKCRFTNRVQTATGASFDTSCRSTEGTATGHTDVQLIDDQHLSANTHLTADANEESGGRTQVAVESTITWKYLGADCGSVKPNTAE